MRRKIPLLLTALAVSLTFSCASDAPDETPDGQSADTAQAVESAEE